MLRFYTFEWKMATVEHHQGKEEEEKERIKRVLEQVGGNKSLAAKVLGIHRTTLWRKMREYGLENLV